MHFYNDNDVKTAAWLGELVARGHLPHGTISTTSINDLHDTNLGSHAQCHFFSGIGGWPLALKLAGIPDDAKVWTGSCPCQPFSCAGRNQGTNDERHLWPIWYELIKQYKPPVIYGEQVASSAVIGRAVKNPNVQQMRDREAVFGVLRELERDASQGVQGMRAGVGKVEEAAAPRQGGENAEGMAGQQPGPCTDERGEAQSENAGLGLQPESCRHSGEDRQGDVRVNGDTVRPDNTTSVECAIAGPHGPRQGLHNGQCAGDPLLGECDGEHMGPPEDHGDCVGDHGETPASFERFVRAAWSESPEAIEPVWLDRIRDDLEKAGYTVGACVLAASSVGAPHIRQRLYWVAVATSQRCNRQHTLLRPEEKGRQTSTLLEVTGSGGVGGDAAADRLAHAQHAVRRPLVLDREAVSNGHDPRWPQAHGVAGACGEVCGVADPGRERNERRREAGDISSTPESAQGETQERQRGRDADCNSSTTSDAANRLDDTHSHRTQRPRTEEQVADAGCEDGVHAAWRDSTYLPCIDHKSRRIEPSSFPLAHGVPARVVRLRGYGNAIVPPLAAEFIIASVEAINSMPPAEVNTTPPLQSPQG